MGYFNGDIPHVYGFLFVMVSCRTIYVVRRGRLVIVVFVAIKLVLLSELTANRDKTSSLPGKRQGLGRILQHVGESFSLLFSQV